MTYIKVQSFVILCISIYGYFFNCHYTFLVTMIAINHENSRKPFFAFFLYFGLYYCNYNGSLKEIHKVWFVVDKMKSGNI